MIFDRVAHADLNGSDVICHEYSLCLAAIYGHHLPATWNKHGPIPPHDQSSSLGGKPALTLANQDRFKHAMLDATYVGHGGDFQAIQSNWRNLPKSMACWNESRPPLTGTRRYEQIDPYYSKAAHKAGNSDRAYIASLSSVL
jgi:hypothetical protein